jgi:hypothetical protein
VEKTPPWGEGSVFLPILRPVAAEKGASPVTSTLTVALDSLTEFRRPFRGWSDRKPFDPQRSSQKQKISINQKQDGRIAQWVFPFKI